MDLDIYQDGGALKTRLRASMVAGDAKCVQTPILYPNRRTNVFLFFNILLLFLIIILGTQKLAISCMSTTHC